MRIATITATTFVLFLLVFILYPVVAEAGERRWVVDRQGRTVGYLEPDAYGSDALVIRDRAGRTVGTIEEGALDDNRVILDHHGDRIERVEGRQGDRRRERRERRDWRDGPAVEWGSHAERWDR